MAARSALFSAALAALAFLVVYGQQPLRVEPMTELCLGCICEAVSNCNRSLACSGDVCGIFRITWAYWADAGKPIIPQDNAEDPGAYARCANDPYCAAKAVTNYMVKFAQDCNTDGVINCYDYAAIHRLGGYGCRGQLDQPYHTRYFQCQQQVAQLVSPGGASNVEFF